MFLDYAKVFLKSGDGGAGSVSFRREKYVPRGGPDGGDGGRGGHLIFKVSRDVTTLSHFRYQHHFKAENGKPGEACNRSGKNGQDIIIQVPVGTVVKDAETGRIIADLAEDGMEYIILRGGRGGRGNSHFATPTRQTPRIAERGEPGLEKWVILELKLLADVGLIGYPNVGKSTLISRISAARPKIADYPFTTIEPNLGVVDHKGKSFVAVDIPGLIDGAHLGVGLGLQFLRHIERTRVLVHLIDVSGLSGRDPYNDYLQINRELQEYNPGLADKVQIIALNKSDLPASADLIKDFIRHVPDKTVLTISAATGSGIDQLLDKLIELLETIPVETQRFEVDPSEPAPQNNEITVEVVDSVYVVKNEALLKRVQRFDMANDESVRSLLKLLKRWKVYEALAASGIKEGDTVRIGDFEFVYLDED